MELNDETLSSLPVTKPEPDTVEIKVDSLDSVEKVEAVLLCCNCSKRLIQATAGLLARCGHTMRTSKCTKTVYAEVVVKHDENTLHLTAFQSCLQKIASDFNKLTESEIVEKLLMS